MKDMTKIGITGTRNGMTRKQLFELEKILFDVMPFDEFHHGDCIGVDDNAATIAKAYGYKVISHPPINPKYRAYNKFSDVVEVERIISLEIKIL